jgi:hypothetical protein
MFNCRLSLAVTEKNLLKYSQNTKAPSNHCEASLRSQSLFKCTAMNLALNKPWSTKADTQEKQHPTVPIRQNRIENLVGEGSGWKDRIALNIK